MKVFNIIMNRGLGGAEQAFLDYNDALTMQGHQVYNIISSFARINKYINQAIKLPNLAPWCFISKIYIKLLILLYKPDLVIVHGGRAINFSCSLGIKIVPIIGVTHSYGTKHILKCDYIIALDEALKQNVIKHGYDKSKIFIVPNMIRILDKRKENFSPPNFGNNHKYIIGSMGRFVLQKGFNYLIEAIRILRDRNYDVNLILGGEGPVGNQLKTLVVKLQLEQNIEFIGWVNDKSNFFKDIDIFCIPSVFETFGIVALEAMNYQVPIVATNTGGLAQIFEHKIDALIAEPSSSEQLTNYIAYIIDKPEEALIMKENAYNKLLNKYNIKAVASLLSTTIEQIKAKK